MNNNFKSDEQEFQPVGSFTDLVTFYGGDHIIFPGLEDTAATIISNLLAAIYNWEPATLPDAFRSNVYQISRLVLAISNQLAKRMGHTRYMEGIATGDQVYVPADQSINQLQQVVTFTSKDMEEILKENKVVPQALQSLLIDTTKINERWLSGKINAFTNTPIYYNNGEYIILHPPSLAKTVVNNIWISAKFNQCTEDVARYYHDLTWNNTKKNLYNLGFAPIADNHLIGDILHRHSLFSIDEDKVAYISYMGDERNDRSPSEEEQEQDGKRSTNSYSHHQTWLQGISGCKHICFKWATV